ncbi:MAG: amidohydrolase [Sphingomonadales bacterium 32-64-17]|nr:MAG: amidohydrolase [Sphingomonadales bacterium 32-64-17]
MTRTLNRENFGPVFDADHHYWESAEAFMRYRDPKYNDRGLRLVEHDGATRYFMGDKLWTMLPGPGDEHLRPVPGSMFDFFAGRDSQDAMRRAFTQKPADHPEYYDREKRVQSLDQQGVEACWMFPSHGVCIEGPLQIDPEASMNILTGFNKWIEEEWGFAYQNRIFSAPFLTLSDPEAAVAELEWALQKGARIVTMRHGPVFTRDGYRSPADPLFDPFWARLEESGITLALHAGQEEAYSGVADAVVKAWGLNVDLSRTFDPTNAPPPLGKNDYAPNFVSMLLKHRLVHDHAAAMISHGLFDRFPRLRVAFVEFGGTWVGPLLHSLQLAHGQYPGMFKTNPVDQFHRNCWVAPFVEDDVDDLARHIPAERILFGSDWPHGEGVAHPLDFFDNIKNFSDDAVRRIMRDNARELTYA